MEGASLRLVAWVMAVIVAGLYRKFKSRNTG
jgi:hypothetical protein